jgi:carboxymethylenebutenolidase
MKTMVREPYVHHVPMLTGAVGYDEVYNFYKNHFVGKMPDDLKIEHISRTVGKDQVVDEQVYRFKTNISSNTQFNVSISVQRLSVYAPL